MRFEFATATRIIFGSGTLVQAGEIVRGWGQRVLVVTGRDGRRAVPLLNQLTAVGLTVSTFSILDEPTVSAILECCAHARHQRIDMVVGFGGGSAIDAAKAVAGLLTNPGDPLDYIETVGQGRPLTQPALPWLAIPTTAGTGAEVTRNAVLSVPERGVKASLRSPLLLARAALIDPELTLDLPPSITASTGLDALTQLIESYVCVRANPISDALCAAAIPRLARALPEIWMNPRSLPARTDAAYASLSSGLALANSGLGSVHGFASVLGGMFKAPHGAVCAALLAPVTRANLTALSARGGASAALRRYDEIAGWLTGTVASAAESLDWIRSLVTELRIPTLAVYGVQEANIPEIVARTQQASSTKGNPIVLTAEELTQALREAI